uniref:Uncharacterized protein n=1 Tax=Anopheles quadriannulatus TaxID=34691 RepID=A0A182XQD0_ANOQN
MHRVHKRKENKTIKRNYQNYLISKFLLIVLLFNLCIEKKEKQFKTNAVADRSIQIIKQGQRGTKRNNLHDLYKTKYQRACELHYTQPWQVTQNHIPSLYVCPLILSLIYQNFIKCCCMFHIVSVCRRE